MSNLSLPNIKKKLQKVYLIGIKGSAMTPLAEIFAHRGIQVVGSDSGDNFFTDELLAKAQAKVYESFSPKNIQTEAPDLVIHSTAYSAKNNEEVAFAEEQGLPLQSLPEAVATLFNQSFGLAVCGTHGKTTTSALLAEILLKGGLDPTALIGSKVTNWQASSLSGRSSYFVLEADEYQNKLQYYTPKSVIVTNIDYDHPDFFPDTAAYTTVFKDFLAKISAEGFLVLNGEDQNSIEASQSVTAPIIWFGEGLEFQTKVAAENLNAVILIKRESDPQSGQTLTVSLKNFKPNPANPTNASLPETLQVKLQLFGRHNALNALAALAAALYLGVDLEKITEALAGFQSSERRFQKMGEVQGALLFDDYAHHPKEVEATLKAARERFPQKKIIAAFHPHTFSRTQKLLPEFAQSLTLADAVYVLKIYASARENQADFQVTAEELVERVNSLSTPASYIEDIPALKEAILPQLNSQTVFITLGAGDIWKVHELLNQLSPKESLKMSW